MAEQAQRTNQDRTPVICTLWVPIHLSHTSQQGPPLSSLSGYDHIKSRHLKVKIWSVTFAAWRFIEAGYVSHQGTFWWYSIIFVERKKLCFVSGSESWSRQGQSGHQKRKKWRNFMFYCKSSMEIWNAVHLKWFKLLLEKPGSWSWSKSGLDPDFANLLYPYPDF